MKFFEWKGHRFIGFVVRLYLAYIFIYASIHKIIHPDSFAVDVATYQILPQSFVNIFAVTLPYVEIGAGLMLLFGFKIRQGALLVCLMMVMFLLALVIALAKGLNMSCGCFASQGVEEDPISFLTVLRDLAWLLLGVYVLVFDKSFLSIDGMLRRRQ
jgi:uncharacterized membrane protein YphA (DoxX/SURF4 family)